MASGEGQNDEPLLRTHSCARLDELLDERNARPERRRQIDRVIARDFAATRAILVLDMAGFSFSVRRNGIVHHLALIRRMHQIVGKVVASIGGGVVKFEADNCYAIFATPTIALNAAIAINRALAAANRDPASEDSIKASIGIGYGKILLGCDDFFGDEVNVACKLGEDIAEEDQIFLTQSAHDKLPRGRFKFSRQHLSVSGIQFNAYKLEPEIKRGTKQIRA